LLKKKKEEGENMEGEKKKGKKDKFFKTIRGAFVTTRALLIRRFCFFSTF
jgi:hypothetical protein